MNKTTSFTFVGVLALLVFVALVSFASLAAGQATTPCPTCAATTPAPNLTVEPAEYPIAYLPDGSQVDVVSLLALVHQRRAELPDAEFFAWVHKHLAQTTIIGTMYVRTSDAPTGSVSWLARDGRPQVMFLGCQEAVPLGYHSLELTTSNVACLNGECLFMAMPLSVDGH